MPQYFQVLKCYKCLIFQVHLTKKSNKWECKLCGEKQSIKRHYGMGTAQECRAHVQKLNVMQGNKNESSINVQDIDSEDDDYIHTTKKEKEMYTNKNNKRKSKWTAFIDENEDVSNISNKSEYCEEVEVVLELPKKQKRNMLYRETENFNEYTEDVFLNTKTCQNDDQMRQCNENFTRHKKWLAYTEDNGLNFNEPFKCNRDDVSLGIGPQTNRCTEMKKDLEFNCNQFTKTNLNTNIMNKIDKNIDLSLKKDVFKNDVKKEETLVFETTESQMMAGNLIEQESKWSKCLNTENEFKRSDKVSHIKNMSKNLFSLCDDNDLDSILDF